MPIFYAYNSDPSIYADKTHHGTELLLLPYSKSKEIFKSPLDTGSPYLAEEVGQGKPDPLPYRVALERLGVAPEEALAFEDSPSGVRSAVGAGIPTYALLTGHRAKDLLEAGAKGVFRDFREALNLL